MQFSNIIGQQPIKQQLSDMVQHNRLSHALLFLGKEGSGALPLAIAFAQYLVCEKVRGIVPPEAAGPSLFGDPEPVVAAPMTDSCGSCPSCQKAAQLIHPDIHFSYPVVSKKSGTPPISTDYITEWREFLKQYPYGNVFDWLQFIEAENKQGNITASECNDIIRKLNLKSFESGYKVLIMWSPEYLGNEGNKLLKLIEEPPANTLFILVAENESLILPTILSRTQLVKIPMLSDRDIEEALVARGNVSAGQARQLAAISEGNYREALNHLNHADEDWLNMVREWMNAILRGGPIAVVKWCEEAAKLGREKQKQFLRYFNHLLETSIRLRVLGEESAFGQNLPPLEKDFALKLNKMVELPQHEALIEELDQAAYYIERNANAKMLFNALSIKFHHIIKDKARVSVW